MNIDTVKDLTRAIKKAKLILIPVRFGLSEDYVKISKVEAEFLVRGIPSYATPAEMEMYSGHFGELKKVDNNFILYLG